jgi:hypothetical protein
MTGRTMKRAQDTCRRNLVVEPSLIQIRDVFYGVAFVIACMAVAVAAGMFAGGTP